MYVSVHVNCGMSTLVFVVSFKYQRYFIYRYISIQLNFNFYFICSVVKRCIPKDILSVIDIAQKNGVDLNEIMNSTDIPLLPNAVKNIEFLAEFETVNTTVTAQNITFTPLQIHKSSFSM